MPVKEPDILLMKIHTEPNILLWLIVLPSFPRRIMWQLLTRPTFIHLVFTFIPCPCGNNKRQLSALRSLVAPYCQSNSVQAFLAAFKGLSNGPVQFSPPVIPSCPFHRHKPGWLTVVLCGEWQGPCRIAEGSIHIVPKTAALDESARSGVWIQIPVPPRTVCGTPASKFLNHSILQSPYL